MCLYMFYYYYLYFMFYYIYYIFCYILCFIINVKKLNCKKLLNPRVQFTCGILFCSFLYVLWCLYIYIDIFYVSTR